ncbi:NAD-dependent epimerase/dehydratase family protein [Comamonas sp. NLF-1-9]|uniref:NAD-dependent epimerase/dehydratase family protein n=1 Tax=Comamonas sp. NLF-1-9 TaxID=2853163 RepID=UPI001C445760|nr:NAD-dependent epimerase/dehydratase family protein [Comamonas sp. NLF-1-9]QXL85161.1 NAD-dependent epimerase/dehydratase family protein [Comamonas sp. NLF-1-9]
MPVRQYPLGCLPSRFRRSRVLIVGCGDIGLRAARLLARGSRVLALSASPERRQALRAAGVVPLAGNLDDAASLARLAGLATRVLHLAPPAPRGRRDARTRALVQALRRRGALQALVYISTTGVYGDCAGAVVTEVRTPAPASDRAWRRLDAETTLRAWGRQTGRVSLLRVPGIYAPDRRGVTPRERVAQASPTLRPEDDVFINHIHADDLARACVRALWQGGAQRIYHVADDSGLRMGEYLDLVAELYGLARVPRVERAQAARQLPASLLDFLSQSRRLDTRRMRGELGLLLRYPTVRDGLQADAAAQRG